MSSSSPSTAAAGTRSLKLLAVLGLVLALSACDYVASFSKPKQTPEEAKAEGIALGAGCRQAGQSLEDCYQRNPDSLKAGIFAGWKDMHEYMAAKNIETVTPPPPEKTEAEAPKDKAAGKDLSAEERAAARRERREREKADADAAAAKSKGSDSDSKSSRKNRDDGSSKK